MTTSQNQLYFRAWQAAAKAHGWNTQPGIADALAAHHAGQVWESPALNQTLATIYRLADNYATHAARNVTANDLRHAVSALATGRTVSSKTFTNADFDRVLALLRVLADPTDLRNLVSLENEETGERRRHVHVITRADASYWQRIAADKFGHADLDRLTLAELRQLSLTIRNRHRARQPREAVAA